ncbi:aspartyl-phosphate phosphatase Spo0E family protein [Paenibacillus ehimensis]|uniref:Aspartyl-phosphate phosphatase Spo0E family protein n=1 Tax=Paenibacillus ehimensis TaxID=79264 RepID=A0ABT8VM12_9BACL|nr:aspartyl-phosphate phosphatase Spo0E family protein [Paenibacillus ehimensis]MDO3682010.1 aspartyl-phosphate phosphatase Spo0E family protein [Paenibacillus ehimensis]
MNRDELRGKIEAVRAELNALAKQVGIQAQAVLVKSQELDELLNQYNRNLKKGEV